VRRRTDVAETLRQRVISARHFGTLAPGGRLPSARVVAAELDVDPRVVVAAYRVLEREGLVEQRPPSRAFYAVAAEGAAAPRVPARRARPASRARSGGPTAAPADDWLAEVLAQALERDIPVPTFPEHARRAVELRRLRAACIECNDDQILWLCRELAEDYGVEADGVEIGTVTALLGNAGGDERGEAAGASPSLPAHRLPPVLRRADLLVTTAAHASSVEALAARAGRPCIVVTHRADLVAELERLLAQGPVYFVGTDPRFADKLRRQFAAWAHGDRAEPVILGEAAAADEVLARLPAGAPAYVMRTVRDRLGGVPPHLRVLSTLRAFSAETRRELLRHVVRANLRVARADAAARA
jgi:GntR family transcriptional regulator